MNAQIPDNNDKHGGSMRRRTPKSIGRASGVANYSREDLVILLNLVERFKPTGKNCWANVTKKYNSHVNQNRNSDCLRRKFLSIMQDKELTPKQESIVSDLVERSKRIHHDIIRSGPNVNMDMDNDEPFDSPGSDEEPVIMNRIHPSNHVYESVGNGHYVTNPGVVDNDMHAPSRAHLQSQDNFNMPRYTSNNNNDNGMIRELPSLNGTVALPTNDIHMAVRQNYEAILSLNNTVNSLISQVHRQHEEVIATLNNQLRSVHQQIQNISDIYMQRTAELTSTLNSFLIPIPSSLSTSNSADNSFPGSTSLDSSMNNIMRGDINMRSDYPSHMSFLPHAHTHAQTHNHNNNMIRPDNRRIIGDNNDYAASQESLYDGSHAMHMQDNQQIGSNGSRGNKRKLDDVSSG